MLVDFWTYTCINWIRTLPYLNEWNEKYADKGLVVFGVHTPEFEFENIDNVMAAAKKFGTKYAVVQDNERGTWNAYKNRYWPRIYLVDNEGYKGTIRLVKEVMLGLRRSFNLYFKNVLFKWISKMLIFLIR